MKTVPVEELLGLVCIPVIWFFAYCATRFLEVMVQ